MPSTRRKITKMLAAGSLLLFTAHANAEGNGLKAAVGDDLWPRWQVRVLATPSFSLWRHAASEYHAAAREHHDSLSLLGDYYFSRQPVDTSVAGGFRATSGLIIGPLGSHVLSAFGSSSRTSLGAGIARSGWPDSGALSTRLDTSTYLGVGYTNISAKSGWGFSADIGVVASNGGSAARFGRASNVGQSLDEQLREMRLSPLLNIGVSYSF